ncbi:hypothetical protein EV385_4318 [Krasilnikovia cinnamomea]|uniref:Uncharacterized protein n=1 Tax=Krasilnikovia cinnamomea TaxID=349313 RepID=A0A4Q7ZPV3_9ACTN|nr:hypothetical protein [Krasilnikovia cinnamomea]RZU52455.1 hypothetical protein EV385_4318 [Krasilnikovia cinnamomea]
MERTVSGDVADSSGMSDASVAVADLPSASGAHWANRDSEGDRRRAGGPAEPFGRTPPSGSLPESPAPREPRPGDATTPDSASWAFSVAPRDAERGGDRTTVPHRGPEPGVSTPERGPQPGADLPRRVAGATTGELPRRVPGSAAGDTLSGDRESHPPRAGATPGRPADKLPRRSAGAAPSPGAAHPSRQDDPGNPAGREAPEPPYGPAPPTTGGRVSFGFTAGPISGTHARAGAPTSPGPSLERPVAVTARPGPPPAAQGREAPPAVPRPAPSPGPTGGAAQRDPAPGRPGGRTPTPVSPVVDLDDAPATPAIGDIVNGPGREIRPHRATRRDPAGRRGEDHKGEGPKPDGRPQPGPGAPPAPRRSRAATAVAAGLTGVILLAGTVAGVVFFSGANGDITSVLQLGAGSADRRTATAPLDGRTAASLEVLGGLGRLTVRSEDLGDQLYRITAADGSDSVPAPVISDDQVRLSVTPDGDGEPGAVEVVLSANVRWSLRFTGGADEQLIDLSSGQVGDVALTGGARRVALTLPKPVGTVGVRVDGALDELSVKSPADAPVRVKVQSGAKTVTAGARTLRDVAPGSTLTPRNWQVPDRYDLDAAARITLLRVETS